MLPLTQSKICSITRYQLSCSLRSSHQNALFLSFFATGIPTPRTIPRLNPASIVFGRLLSISTASRPGDDFTLSKPLRFSRATLDMGPSRVLYLLDCPYDGPSTMVINKKLIAAGSALWTPSFKFATHMAHHVRQVARERRIMNTPQLYYWLTNTLSAPPAKANSAAIVQVSPAGRCLYTTSMSLSLWRLLML